MMPTISATKMAHKEKFEIRKEAKEIKIKRSIFNNSTKTGITYICGLPLNPNQEGIIHLVFKDVSLSLFSFFKQVRNQVEHNTKK